MRTNYALALLAMPLSLSGCLTFSGDELAEITVEPATSRPAIEHTVGDFRFEQGGDALISANQVGQRINEQILDRWVESDWISRHRFVQTASFTDEYPLRLTLSGRQRDESSTVMQFISGLTLFLIPFSVDSKMSLQLTLENAKSGCIFAATAAESYDTVVGLLLIPALPFWQIGSNRSFEHLADHLYSQLAARGAFGEHAPCEADRTEFSIEARTRALDKMLSDGLISRSEYEDRIAEPFLVTGESADPVCSLSLVPSDAQTKARFDFRASELGMVPGTLRCASTASTVSIDTATVEVCADGHRYRTLATSTAIGRAYVYPGSIGGGGGGGFIVGVQTGMKQARNKDVVALFEAGKYGPAELGPGKEAEGFIFFDVPGGGLSAPSGATLQMRDLGTGDTRALHLGDASPCTGR